MEASHGCAHRCRHCPVPVVYDGRTRLVGEDVVVADVAGLVASGARHITFGDPDFLNGPHHSLRVVRAVHERFPQLTFDCTTKVEHILAHRGIWREMAAAGCLFVVSAFESLNDDILARLDKGHTAAQAAEAVEILRAHGIEIAPVLAALHARGRRCRTWPTSWTSSPATISSPTSTRSSTASGCSCPRARSCSATTSCPLGPYDPELLSYAWLSPDARVDALQARLASIAEEAAATGEAAGTTYLRIRRATAEAMGADSDDGCARRCWSPQEPGKDGLA